jgi:hypothetical protein
MGSHRQRFGNDLAALEALLRGEMGRNSHNLASGAFSLLLQQSEKRAPTRLGNAFGQGMVLYHPGHIQVFYVEDRVAIHIMPGCLVQKVFALSGDLQVGLGNFPRRLAASEASLLASAERSLLTS